MSTSKIKFGDATSLTDWDRNLVTTGTAGLKVADILDDSNSATGISLTFDDAFSGPLTNAGCNDSGGWPGVVFDSCLFNNLSTAKDMTFAGFDAGEEVTFNFSGQRNNGSAHRDRGS